METPRVISVLSTSYQRIGLYGTKYRATVLSLFDTALNANSTELLSMADGIVNLFRYAERGSLKQLLVREIANDTATVLGFVT